MILIILSCADGIIRCCVPKVEILIILEACHSSPVGGHHCGIWTTHKILEGGYYWNIIHQDAHKFAKTYVEVFLEGKSSL